MSEIVSGALKLTFGILSNKIRSDIVKRLEDGDVTNEECRRMIVGEIEDIKGKLEGLARKDLLSGLCNLEDGISRLYQSLESREGATIVEADASSRDTGPDSSLNEAVTLINAITLSKIRSNERFKSAIESFKLAHEKATDAFCNKALSIEDRIQASQIRMMARLLDSLEDPDAGVSDCLRYLKALHDEVAIQEMFSVLIDGGVKSRFNQTSRLDNASSVHNMNKILFDFTRKFTKLPQGVLDWPTISLGEKVYHPVFGERRLDRKFKESGVKLISSHLDVAFDDEIVPNHSAVNSKGEIVGKISGENTLTFCRRSEKSLKICDGPRKDGAGKWYVRAMDIDADDNTYVVARFQERKSHCLLNFILFIFDANGNRKFESRLDFLNFRPRDAPACEVSIAVNKQKDIAILKCENKIVYIGNVYVELNLYEVNKTVYVTELSLRKDYNTLNLLSSDSNEMKIITSDDNTVYIYSENGELQKEIKMPKEQGVIYSVAVNHVTKRILIKTDDSQGHFSLLSFSSETGEPIDSLYLGSNKWIRYAKLHSHLNGPVVLVGKTGAAILQL